MEVINATTAAFATSVTNFSQSNGGFRFLRMAGLQEMPPSCCHDQIRSGPVFQTEGWRRSELSTHAACGFVAVDRGAVVTPMPALPAQPLSFLLPPTKEHL